MEMTSALIFVLSTLFTGAFQTQDAPASRAELYAVGEEFAGCAGYAAFAAEVAHENGREDAAITFSGMERSWTLAGTELLIQGLEPSRQAEAEALFKDVKRILVARLKADRVDALASGVENYDTLSDDLFARKCEGWVELQRAIIDDLQDGSSGSEP